MRICKRCSLAAFFRNLKAFQKTRTLLHYNRQYLTVAADKDIEVPEQKSVLELDLTPVTAKRILREMMMKGSLYHYESCGLPGIWLRNGFVIKNTQYGEAVSIHNLEGLHHAIGLDLVNNRPALSSDEIRFLRKEMDLPQTRLASLLSVSESTVRNWENGRVEIPGPADRILRTLYLEFVQGKSKVRDMLERISQLNRDLHEDETREYTEQDGNWRSAA